ncbi:MAG: DNA adenine methylase [Anaerolineae bacterium]|nr:DNA adenine methylase [Anaerolineae bacterium]
MKLIVRSNLAEKLQDPANLVQADPDTREVEQLPLLDGIVTSRGAQPRSPRSGRGLSPIYLDKPHTPERSSLVYTRRQGKKRIVFGWYGGKFSHLEWLLPLLPDCHHYCEPFAGSGAVLLNRRPAPVETYNDIDGDVVNFFRVLRDRTEELEKAIALTPFSREEFYFAIHGDTQGISDVERARRFYIRARQARTGLAQTATLGRWANCKDTSRAGMSGVVSRWLGGVAGLDEIAARLLRVQIENRPAVNVIRLYDGPRTLFYCDPPYLHSTRGDAKAYGFEMSEEEHRELATVLNQCQGMAAISGYRCDLLDDLYQGWRRFDAPKKKIHSVKQTRQESLWMNY